MIHEIQLSQVLALIGVGYRTKTIWCDRISMTMFEAESPEEFIQQGVPLRWKDEAGITGRKMALHIFLDDLRKPYYTADKVRDRRYWEPIFRAYYFEGDNCNDYSQFIYELIGNKIAIVDDIRLAGSNYGVPHKNNRPFNLLDVDPHQVLVDIVNRYGRWKKK